MSCKSHRHEKLNTLSDSLRYPILFKISIHPIRISIQSLTTHAKLIELLLL